MQSKYPTKVHKQRFSLHEYNQSHDDEALLRFTRTNARGPKSLDDSTWLRDKSWLYIPAIRDWEFLDTHAIYPVMCNRHNEFLCCVFRVKGMLTWTCPVSDCKNFVYEFSSLTSVINRTALRHIHSIRAKIPFLWDLT